MAQKKHTPEQIIRKLRDVEVAQGKGKDNQGCTVLSVI